MDFYYSYLFTCLGGNKSSPATASWWINTLLHTKVHGVTDGVLPLRHGREFVCNHAGGVTSSLLLWCAENRHENENSLLFFTL